METQLLREQGVLPEKEVLESALTGSYPVFEELMEIITDPKYGLVPVWNYYKDGKAWLCKVCYKKKTVFWLSVWDGYFKTSFYFTEKNGTGITGLDIEESLKEGFSRSKLIGRLIPLIVDINKKEQIRDLLKIVDYKKSLK